MSKDYEMVFVNQEELKELLEKAFDGGWKSYLDLKETVVEEILSTYLAEREKTKSKHNSPTPCGVLTQGTVPRSTQHTFWDRVDDHGLEEDPIVTVSGSGITIGSSPASGIVDSFGYTTGYTVGEEIGSY